MTSVARPRSVSGRVIPSALAVIRLLINFLVSVVYCGHGVARRQRNVIALGAHRRHS